MAMSRHEAGKLGGQKTQQYFMNKYNANPKKCIYCESNLSYEQRKNKFCNQSCSAKYNNSLRKDDSYCLACNSLLSGKQKKYCNHFCQHEHVFQDRLKELLSGTNVDYNPKYIRNLLVRYYDGKCNSCGLSEWMGKEMPVEVHHIDGKANNNTFDNLTLLCCNCHALTDNFKRKNTSSTRTYRK